VRLLSGLRAASSRGNLSFRGNHGRLITRITERSCDRAALKGRARVRKQEAGSVLKNKAIHLVIIFVAARCFRDSARRGCIRGYCREFMNNFRHRANEIAAVGSFRFSNGV
jgi:hypothetical protein